MNGLTTLVIKLAGKRAGIKNIPGPQGVRGRTSDNTLIKEKLGWTPSQPLHVGLTKTYKWIADQIKS
jgi:nucleoside-diphosphate-sugar epimerase